MLRYERLPLQYFLNITFALRVVELGINYWRKAIVVSYQVGRELDIHTLHMDNSRVLYGFRVQLTVGLQATFL